MLDDLNKSPTASSQSVQTGQAANRPDTLQQIARTGQIITFALAQGCLVIAVIFWFVNEKPDKVEAAGVYILIGSLAFVMCLIAAFFVPAMMRSHFIGVFRDLDLIRGLRETSATDRDSAKARDELIQWDPQSRLPDPVVGLLAGDQTARLVGQACLEGAGVINLVFWLLSASPIHLFFVVINIVGIISMLPTISKLRQMIDRALEVGGVSGEVQPLRR